MYKRGLVISLVFVLLILMLFNTSFVVAEEGLEEKDEFIDSREGDCGDFDCGELDLVDAGTTPDSFFSFFDDFFDGFGDEIKVKEEKVAEIKQMIEEGKIKDARKALQKYKKFAKVIEEESDPENFERAEKSAAVIRKALKEIEEMLSDEEKEEFVGDVLDNEEKIMTAVEISGKIKELCQTLAELDPLEYSDVCSVGEDAPNWKRELNRELTKEQEQEAKKFAKIMSQCFKTSGEDCACEEIPFVDFSKACSKAAVLATACDLGGDEEACGELDSLEMPRLPDHLQAVFEDLEEGMNEDKFDMHMPRECVEAGVTSPKECSKIMIQKNAPEECKEALLKADIKSEMEGRKICDEIMFELHSPKECIDKGITDPEECMGFMDNFRGPDGPRMDMGPRMDFDCGKIEDSMERLDCYDKAGSQMKSQKGFDDKNYEGNCMTDQDWKNKKKECQDLYGRHAGDEPIYGDSGEGYECVVDAKCIDFGEGKESFEDIKMRERKCADDCGSKDMAWDFTGGRCVCQGGDYDVDDSQRRVDGGAKCDDCASQCPDASRTSCGPNGCECHYDGDEYNEPDDEGGSSDYEEENYDNGGSGSSSGGEGSSEGGSSESGSSSSGGGGSSSSGGEGDSGSSDSENSDSSSSDSGSSDSESSSEEGDSSESAPITGNVFLDYYFR